MSSTPTAVTPPATAVVRPAGWWRLFVGITLALAVPVVAQLRLIAPIEQTIMVIVPVMAAAALAAWRAGGRLWLFLAWGVLAAWMIAAPSAGSAGAFGVLTRGWVVVLAASFGLISLANPRATFLARSLSAIGLSFAVALVILMVGRGSAEDAGRVVAGEFGRRLDAVLAESAARQQLPEFQELSQRYPSLASMVEQGESQLPALTRAAIDLFPALLALESLLLLALGWALFHRASRTRIGPPLSLLCQFRFNDQLVWGVVLGVTLLVLPGLAELRAVGMNLTLFFGALYAFRGLGVIAWFLAPGRPAPVLLVCAACLAGPVVGVFSVGLGLADTWIDWRGRLRPAA